MPGVIRRFSDLVAGEPLRVRAILRLFLIALIAFLIGQQHVSHWQDGLFTGVLVSYAVVAVAWVILILRSPGRWWFPRVSTFVDIAILLVLCIVSGAGTIALYPIFFLLPISVAFLDSPRITALLGLSVSVGYLAAWLIYALRDPQVPNHIPSLVYVQVGCLLWLTAAITALSATLARRRNRVRALLKVQRRLVAETMRADERNSYQLSEQLHDGPLQNLLAARLDLDDLRDNPTREGFERLDAALRETVTDLRTTVSTLHPQVLAQVGLTAAVSDLAEGHRQRWGITVYAALHEVGRPRAEALIHRAARELLANVHKHSRASGVEIGLHRDDHSTILRVADDGIGFDPEVLVRRVNEGHIGLASLFVAVEALGGSVEFAERPGGGTIVTVTVPDEGHL